MLEPSHNALNVHLDYVFDNLPCAAKINISFGYLLRNVETEEFTYYYAQSNTAVFTLPIMVANSMDLDFLRDRVDHENFFRHMMRERPDTNSRFYKITNVVITATLLLDVPMGCPQTVLPDFLHQSKQVHTLLTDSVGKDTRTIYAFSEV